MQQNNAYHYGNLLKANTPVTGEFWSSKSKTCRATVARDIMQPIQGAPFNMGQSVAPLI